MNTYESNRKHFIGYFFNSIANHHSYSLAAQIAQALVVTTSAIGQCWLLKPTITGYDLVLMDGRVI